MRETFILKRAENNTLGEGPSYTCSGGKTPCDMEKGVQERSGPSPGRGSYLKGYSCEWGRKAKRKAGKKTKRKRPRGGPDVERRVVKFAPTDNEEKFGLSTNRKNRQGDPRRT